LDEFRLLLGEPGFKEGNLFVFGIAGWPPSLIARLAECRSGWSRTCLTQR
jgi:hypothetical protein